MNTTQPRTWFSEPSVIDNTYANREEHYLDWLDRSTLPCATECRRFLNEHLAKLSHENQSLIVHNLRVKWKSTFFELICARILQELGASLIFESPNSNGKCPDFVANFNDMAITVEANSPVINGKVTEKLKSRVPLLNYIESRIPDGWFVSVWELPEISPNHSIKHFQRIVDYMLNIPPPSQGDTAQDLIQECVGGVIRLQLIPKFSNSTRLASEGIICSSDDSQDRIKNAVKRKRKQVRDATNPVLLAIEISDAWSEFEDFDLALFGCTFACYDKHNLLIEEGFLPNGIFNNRSSKAPTYAGVLAFSSVGFQKCVGPVLYLHPRFTGMLPIELLQLEQRFYDQNSNRVLTLPSKIDLSERLHFVNL